MQFRTTDAHAIIENFVKAGFDKKIAEDIVYALKESHDLDLNHLATKEDVALLRADLKQYATKEDLAETKIELVKEMSQNKVDLIKWMISLQIITITFMCGVIGIATTAILKVVIH
jgi:hypothetical protein